MRKKQFFMTLSITGEGHRSQSNYKSIGSRFRVQGSGFKVWGFALRASTPQPFPLNRNYLFA